MCVGGMHGLGEGEAGGDGVGVEGGWGRWGR